MPKLTDFSNDLYLVLKTLYTHQVKVGDDIYVPLTQQEIADIMGISRVKLNHLLNDLIDGNYVQMHQGIRGKYHLTSRGLCVVQIFEGSIPQPAAK